MKIIDRYLVKQFIRTFLIFFCSFTGLYIVVDFFGNVEEFLSHAKQQGSLVTLLIEYYGYRTLPFFNLVSGTLALISAMFTVAWIQQGSELTALQAAGITKRRVVMPIIIAGAVVSIISVANREWLIPTVRHKMNYNAQQFDDSGKVAKKPQIDRKTNILFTGEKTFVHEKRISKPNFHLPRNLDEFGKRLVAENAYYLEATDDRPSGYLMKGVSQPIDLLKQPTVRVGNQPVILTPVDTKWLAKDELFVLSELSFEHFEGGNHWRQMASTAELIDGLDNPSIVMGADVRVTIHSRIVQPFLDVTLLFLGLPLILKRQNRNIFVSIGLCGLIVMVFTLTVIGFQYLGSNYLLDPAKAAWLPLFVFVPLAVYLADPFRE